jgi:hypothetical protein
MGSTLNVALAVEDDARAVARITGTLPAQAQRDIQQARHQARAKPCRGALLVVWEGNTTIVGTCRIWQNKYYNVVLVQTEDHSDKDQIRTLLRADALVYCDETKETIIC